MVQSSETREMLCSRRYDIAVSMRKVWENFIEEKHVYPFLFVTTDSSSKMIYRKYFLIKVMIGIKPPGGQSKRQTVFTQQSNSFT